MDKEILKIDIGKQTSYILLLSVMSFFIHLVLHNYNSLRKNSLEEAFSTRQINESRSSPLLEEPIANLESPLTNLVGKTEEKPTIIISDKKVVSKKLNYKKLGNVLVISIAKGDTLIDVLKEGKITNTTSISEAVNKKYKLNNIKPGDVLQLENLSRNAKVNLRLVLVNKVAISIKESGRKYIVLVKDLSKKEVIQPQIEIKTNIINLKQQSIHKLPLTQDLKRDLGMIVQLLQHEKINPSKVEIIYEKKSSKSEKLLYVDLGNMRVYKYRDKSGITHYVKQNGTLLSRASGKKPTQSCNFKMSYPVNNPVIGSGFGMRHHPIMGRVRMHKGIDFRACRGTPIHAPADGVITEINHARGFGKYIRMKHNGVYTTLYAHLDNFARDKRVGMKVKKGEVIGYVGKTGIASGEHLHFEVHENGRPVNPMRLISNGHTIKDESIFNQLNKRQLLAFKNYQSQVEKKVQAL